VGVWGSLSMRLKLFGINGTWNMGYGISDTGYGIRNMDYGIRDTDYGLRVMDYGLYIHRLDRMPSHDQLLYPELADLA
jgi:hypothetical protein